jgi:hypothetical protein
VLSVADNEVLLLLSASLCANVAIYSHIGKETTAQRSKKSSRKQEKWLGQNLVLPPRSVRVKPSAKRKDEVKEKKQQEKMKLVSSRQE